MSMNVSKFQKSLKLIYQFLKNEIDNYLKETNVKFKINKNIISNR